MRGAVKRYTVLLEFLVAPRILPGCVWSVPTVSVSCGSWECGFALETEKAESREKAQKTRRVPTVSCIIPAHFRDAVLGAIELEARWLFESRHASFYIQSTPNY